jgi:phosphoribosylglycinamide formyltransferase-1
MRIGVLASGEGTNLQALLDTVHGREAEVVAVASDKRGAPALRRATDAGVETGVFERDGYAERVDRDMAIADWLDERGVELVVLAGYMALLSPRFIDRYPDRIVNVHPALLPAFPGIRVIEQALDYGVKVFGVTVHFVDAGVDTGSIILQRAIELPDAREPHEVHAQLQPLEHALLPEAVRRIAAGTVRRDPEHPRRVLSAPAA